MDYLKQPLGFKIKKVLRYLKMYGGGRTYIKVLGQLHMRKEYESLAPYIGRIGKKQTVGLIGCGNYAFSNIAYFLNKTFGKVLAGCMDINENRAASLASHYGIPIHTGDSNEIIQNKNICLIYIASNHASHAEYAIKALNHGKHVYIEKPHVVSLDQLFRLYNAMKSSKGKIFLGFNRPRSRFGSLIRRYLGEQSGQGMYNWFIAGHAIDPDHWYFSEGEGGRVLGNLCHWIDFVFRMVAENTYPLTINPTRHVKSDCDIVVTYVFGEGTIANISFSAKGHTFEGVKESFRAQKGNVLITMDDFKRMTVEIADAKKRYHNFYRDHGHRHNIVSAYKNVHFNEQYCRETEYSQILNSAWLFLKTKEALEKNERITLNSFEESLANMPGNRGENMMDNQNSILQEI